MSPRQQMVRKLSQKLIKQSFPRIDMFLLICVTTAFGMFMSYVLLRLGMGNMLIRFPLAFTLAYLFFLFLLLLWLRKTESNNGLQDLPDSGFLSCDKPPASPSICVDDPMVSTTSEPGTSLSLTDATDAKAQWASNSAQSTPSIDVDASGLDLEGLPVLLVGLLIAACISIFVCAGIYLIYIAPVLFAEILIDAAAGLGLLHYAHRHKKTFWLHTAVRKTFIPYLVSLVLLVLLSLFLTQLSPDAHTFREALQQHHK